MYFQAGAIPGVNDIEGRKAFKKAIMEEIKKLGGRPKGSLGLGSLRREYSKLLAKKRMELKK